PLPDFRNDRGCGFRPERAQLEQSIPASPQTLCDLLMRRACLFDQTIKFDSRRLRTFGKPLREVVEPRAKPVKQFCAAFQILLECIQRLLVPAHQDLMRTSDDVRNVDLNFRSLTDAIEPANALLE